MSDDLKNKILEKLHHQKPYSHWRFVLIDTVRILCILILLFVAGFALAYFVWDVIEAKLILDPDDGNIFHVFWHGLPEILLALLLISSLMYYLYRQTDLPLVKNRVLLFGSVWAILILISTGIIFTVQNNRSLENGFFGTQEQLENLPYRPKRFDMMYQTGRRPDVFMGRVVDIVPINETDLKIIIKNRFEQIEVVVNIDQLTSLEIDEDVLVRLDPQNPARVLDIREAPHRPFNPLNRPMQP
jgi:hypothetical protein